MSQPTAGTFCWYELATPDAARAKDFYSKLFGWTAEDHPMPGGMEGSYTMFRIDGKDVCGAYVTTGHMAGIPPHWAAYVASDDVDATASAAKTAGATLLQEPLDVPTVGRICALRAPGGEAISLFGAGEHRGSAVDPNTPGAFCWAELMTRDIDTAGSFYTKVFPWSAKTMDLPTGPYTVFSAGEAMVAGMMAMPPVIPAEVPPHWMPYVLVTDCKATTEKARELGATFMVENHEVPTVGTFSLLADPTGAALSFIQFLG